MDPAMLDEIRHITARNLEPFPTKGRIFLTDLLFKPRPAPASLNAAGASESCDMVQSEVTAKVPPRD